MPKTRRNKLMGLTIESPIKVGTNEITLSEPKLELGKDENLMIYSDNRGSGNDLVRAVLGLERLSRGVICVKTEEKDIFLDKKRNSGYFWENIGIAFVHDNGSDFCQDLTILENLNLVKKEEDSDFVQRVEQLASDFMVEDCINDFPDSIGVTRRKIYSIIRAWAYLPDIIVFSDPLKHLDDLSSIEILRHFSMPNEDLSCMNIILAPSRGEFSNVIHNFHVVEIID